MPTYPNYPGSRPGTHAATHGPGGSDPLNLAGMGAASTIDLDAEIARATAAEALLAPIASPTFTGTVGGITKTMVGLGNVDNTSDVNKPVSTAQQTALDLKADLVGGTVPIAQIPTSDIQIIFRKGTDAERQTVIFAEGEGIYTTDLKEFWVGDGVTLGGVPIGTPPDSEGQKFFVQDAGTSTAGTNLGGIGTPGSIGTASNVVRLRWRRGSGGNNSASGTGNGGNGGAISPALNGLIRVESGNGGAASGNFIGGAGGPVTNLTLISAIAGSGGAAGAGGHGGAGGLISAFSGLLRVGSGAGGNGGSGAAGGNGGNIKAPFLNFRGGAGGAGGAGGEFGGVGGVSGVITLDGGNGATGSGGVAGGAGGAAGSLTLSGSSASGTTPGAAGGTINLTAVGSTAAPHILCGNGVPASSPPNGSLYLRMDGGAGSTLYVRESDAWVAK